MKNIYTNGDYQERNPDWHHKDAIWKAGKILGLIKKAHLSPKTVCDVGCGTGGIITELSKQMKDVKFSGFDISQYAIKIAKKHNERNIEFHLGELPKSKSDLVMLIDVLEHVENCPELLQELKKSADFQIFHIPLTLSVLGVLKKDFYVRERHSVGHLHIFSKDLVFSLLRENGYEIIAWEYTAPAIDRADNRLISRIGRVARIMLRAINKDLAAKLVGGFSILVLTK